MYPTSPRNGESSSMAQRRAQRHISASESIATSAGLLTNPCGRCDYVFVYQVDTPWRTVSQMVNQHWQSCPGGVNATTRHLRTRPPRTESLQPQIALRPQSLSPVSERQTTPFEPPRAVQVESRKKNMMDEEARRAKLESDPWSGEVTPKSVRCRACGRTVSLDKRSRYYPGLWLKHRGKCMEIKRLEAISNDGRGEGKSKSRGKERARSMLEREREANAFIQPRSSSRSIRGGFGDEYSPSIEGGYWATSPRSHQHQPFASGSNHRMGYPRNNVEHSRSPTESVEDRYSSGTFSSNRGMQREIPEGHYRRRYPSPESDEEIEVTRNTGKGRAQSRDCGPGEYWNTPAFSNTQGELLRAKNSPGPNQPLYRPATLRELTSNFQDATRFFQPEQIPHTRSSRCPLPRAHGTSSGNPDGGSGGMHTRGRGSRAPSMEYGARQ